VALVSHLALLGLVGATLLSAVGLVLRFRRAHGDERQQLKWVVSAVVVWVLTLIAVVLAPLTWQPFREFAYVLALGGFVASFGLAILKYRLYDIDVVIGRTLVYGLLAASIGLVYVGVVAGLGAVIGTRGEPNLALSLVATAVVAVLFQPLRERLHRLASRLVYGQRATPYGVLAGFSRRIGGALSLDEVLPRVAEAVAHGVGAARSRVRVYVPGGVDHSVAWPAEAIDVALEQTALVLHRGEAVGEISVSKLPGEPLTLSERMLLDDLATQAGPAFSNVRLTEELRASRQRIVAAQDAERRRIERDLHDGAQQHLVAISVNLRVVQELIDGDIAAARELLVEVQGQATEALATMRDLARGIYPPALADRGIAAALEAHLAKSRLRSRLEVSPAVDGLRFTPAVEAAVYFWVLEALQNCSKHAPDASVGVHLQLESDVLTFGVTDDGQGFDRSRTNGGTGLQGMADRISAVGGSLRVNSVPGRGTSIVGTLPLTA
jgi:signal transduction histidine kinase